MKYLNEYCQLYQILSDISKISFPALFKLDLPSAIGLTISYIGEAVDDSIAVISRLYLAQPELIQRFFANIFPSYPSSSSPELIHKNICTHIAYYIKDEYLVAQKVGKQFDGLAAAFDSNKKLVVYHDPNFTFPFSRVRFT